VCSPCQSADFTISMSESDVVDGARSRHRTAIESSSQTNHMKDPGSTMQITTIGLDIAKNVFQVHGIDDTETTRVVEPYTNYRALPMSSPRSATGKIMKLTSLGSEIVDPYWNEFGPISKYKVVLPSQIKKPCLTTKEGDMPVGQFSGAMAPLERSFFSLTLISTRLVSSRRKASVNIGPKQRSDLRPV
jgi:hypothetical protein